MLLEVSLGDIAGIVAAIAFVVLVALSAIPLIKLGKLIDATRQAVNQVGTETVPVITELRGTVAATNVELEKLSMVTEDLTKVSNHAVVVGGNAAQVSSLLGTTIARPLIKVAGFQAGLKKAFTGSSTTHKRGIR